MIRQSLTDVIKRRNEALLKNDVEAFAALFAPDGVIEQPFAANGMPTRLEGRETIRAFSVRAFSGVRFEGLEEIAVHHTDDPEVAIVEQSAQVTIASSGQSVSTRSINLFRIRDGAIVLFRTYTGPGPNITPPATR